MKPRGGPPADIDRRKLLAARRMRFAFSCIAIMGHTPLFSPPIETPVIGVPARRVADLLTPSRAAPPHDDGYVVIHAGKMFRGYVRIAVNRVSIVSEPVRPDVHLDAHHIRVLALAKTRREPM